ncbi:MAG: hypothetical protein JRI57_03850 [Deltaproteobacteria bacterium]|nr:hypothetical protein [Deltaproteobacteria bacterium]MBW1952482.1 hypothetical protein [Deltaproteobacteria bacterium]MBW1987333.1 hypothetical protein [Deltaproteobacteria bacterium]MBW2135295.1 hypothetical protein [Deltaproteobacteria bacterium]
MKDVISKNSVTEQPAPEDSPPRLFRQIQDLFRRLGIFGQKLPLEFEGYKYLISCDERAFLVYRINEQCGVPPGIPGWPVCLVTAETVVDECSPSPLECEFFNTGLALADWLEIIEQYYRLGPDDEAAFA